MPLNDYIDQFFSDLEQVGTDGSTKKGITVVFGHMTVDTWRKPLNNCMSRWALPGIQSDLCFLVLCIQRRSR